MEFSSISVSSYEPGALADQLTQQASDGWSVVAIVPTGSTVTAYLSRESNEAASSAAPAVASEAAAPDSDSADEGAAPEPAAAGSNGATSGADESTSHPTPTSADGSSSVTTDTAVAEAPGWAAESGASEPSEPAESPAAGGAAPAGWYADPSSRFELRYWDGSQWTEHVSRAGQQYTDPPVA